MVPAPGTVEQKQGACKPMDRTSWPVVAIINTSEEVIRLLQEVLDDEGFATAAGYVLDFKEGRADIDSFFQQHRPRACIFDIAIPYAENWDYFRNQVVARNFLAAECFVVTTTNKEVLTTIVGPNPSIEMIGRPYDLDTIVQAVRNAVARCEEAGIDA
jgi:hypothetical protein